MSGSARAVTARVGGRRTVLSVLLLIACGAAFAQDPRAGFVQKAARDWLAQADKLDAPASFNAAGSRFRDPISVEQWADALAKAREPLGAALQRTVMETAFDKAKEKEDAEFEIAVIRYRTAFAKRLESYETLTLEYEADGAWRVIGYFIR